MLVKLHSHLLLLVIISFSIPINYSSASHAAEEIIDVGARKQLFVDEFLIASKNGVRLVMNPPYRTGEMLVDTREKPWEQGGQNTGHYDYSSVLKEDGRIRIWYDAVLGPEDRNQIVCYTESKDGIHFTKPLLGLVDVDGSKENNVVIGPGDTHGAAVWIDPNAPPEKRYRSQSKGRGGLNYYASADGLRWKIVGTVDTGGHIDTQNVIFWDEIYKKYVLYSRGKWMAQPKRYRAVRRAESTDLSHWTNTGLVFDVSAVDWKAYPTITGEPPVDYYGAGVFKYEGVYLMYVQTFWHWKARPKELKFGVGPYRKINERANRQQLGPNGSDVRLATSRDGKTFERAGGWSPFLRPGPQGSFDSKWIWAMPGVVRMGDELWIYYTGTNRGHDDILDPAAPGGKHQMGISRAVMRLDGFVSVDAPYEGGEMTTPLIRFAGKQMQLNLDTSAGGCVRVELLDKVGKPVDGFTAAEATPLVGNSVRMPVTWGDESNISKLAGIPVRIRFIMRDCKLYAFQFIP
ncbi:MAG: hypothetical protein JXM70_05580 [Pirellulales bacterium]|nr:hypothetical protein [Pirellulales bacterium]